MYKTLFSKQSYNQSHCWQYEMRQQNLEEDLKAASLSFAKASTLRVSDFKFSYIPKDNKEMCQRIKYFILRHEWLGKMPHRPTHRFVATYKGHLAGVIVMATPNTFSYLLGRDNRDKEKLISRGACISWSPKNLASSLLMFSVRWMVQSTPYRYFSAYSDPEAKELGTIYQACNFIYLGQNSGAKFEYQDPNSSENGWFSDRRFRKATSYKRYAFDMGIGWEGDWSKDGNMCWSRIPKDIASSLRQASKAHEARCIRRRLPRKHKYVYILGRDKNETRELIRAFEEVNPEKKNLAYPKERGVITELIQEAA